MGMATTTSWSARRNSSNTARPAARRSCSLGGTGGRLFTYKSTNHGDRVGESLAGPLDGKPDFLVGVPGSNDTGNLTGRAQLSSEDRGFKPEFLA